MAYPPFCSILYIYVFWMIVRVDKIIFFYVLFFGCHPFSS
nr:MAG TPA: hypothetical protein [Caudoviricetes sp.]